MNALKGIQVILLLVALFFVTIAKAQIPADLHQQLVGKRKLADIMQIVERYYEMNAESNQANDGKEEEESALQRWERWALFMSARLDINGELVDVGGKNVAALQQIANTNSPQLAYGNWSSLGPRLVNGVNSGRGLARVDRIAFHPTDSNIIYAGTPAGGLYKTTNGGTSWTNVSAYLPALGISGIVVSHADGNTIYILTGDGDSFISNWPSDNVPSFIESYGYGCLSQGVWKSTDAGQTWQQTGRLSQPGTYNGFKLVQDPSNANVLLAATTTGLYRTNNGGDTWTQVMNNLVGDVVFQPGAASTRAFASGDGWIKYSTDDGLTWSGTPIYDIPISNPAKIALAVAKTNVNVVYAYSGYSTSNAFGGIYKSVNAGANFVQQCNSPNISDDATDGSGDKSNNHYALAIAVSSTNSTHINTGSLILWRSVNSGVTMINATHYFEDTCGPTTCIDLAGYVHPDIHCLAYNPLNNKLYVGCDGGVWVSANEGVDYTDISNGIDAAQVYHVSGIPGNQDSLFAGMQDNGVNIRTAASTTFQHLAGGDGYATVIDPVTPGQGYCTINKSFFAWSNNFTTTSGIPPTSGEWYGNIMVNPSNPNMVFVGYSNVYKSSNRGVSPANWSSDTAAGNWCMTACPSNSARYYAAGAAVPWSRNGELFRSDDTGGSWFSISTDPSFPSAATRTKITDIGVDPNNSLHIWACFGGYHAEDKVYYSVNGGTTWVNKTFSLPNVAVNSIVVANGNSVYVGTDIGVYYLAFGATDWVPFYNGIPKVPITDLIINNSAGTITASTFGRGLWRSALHSICTATLNISWNINSDQFYEASNDLNSSSYISGNLSGATRVYFKSGNYLKFTPGFEVKAGNEFKAFIGACGSGNPVFRQNQLKATERDSTAVIINNMEATRAVMITKLKLKQSQVDFDFMVREAGTIQFILTDNQFNGVLKTGIAQADTGSFNETMELGKLKPGLYYLHVILNNKSAHYQEVEIR